MIIVIYSNCQGKGLQYYLQTKIKAKYHHIENYKYFENKTQLPLNILKNADVFIFQFTNKKHKIYSTDPTINNSILSTLNKNCIKIGIPSIFQSSFWPIIPGFGSCREGHNIIKELKKKYTLNHILKMYDNNEINFKLKDRFIRNENHTKEIEKFYIKNLVENCKIITITPFIQKYHKKYKLFFTHCHPTSYIYVYITNEIIKELNTKKKLNIKEYELFTQKLIEGNIPIGDWKESKYVTRELEVKYINDTSESFFKQIIKNVYKSLK